MARDNSLTKEVVDGASRPGQLVGRESRLHEYTVEFDSQEFYYGAHSILRVIDL